jgi:predicted RNA-binding Zn ribbon-like protein
MHPIDAVLPGEPPVVRFMNTVWGDRFGTHDALESEADLVIVLKALGLEVEREVTPRDLERARRLRDALRRLAAAATHDERTRAATDLSMQAGLKEVNSTLRDLPPRRLEHAEDRWSFQAMATTVRHALAELAGQGGRLMVDPEQPVRACYAPGCVLYFVQHHARREWCSPECGNRARAARHYARHRTGASAD